MKRISSHPILEVKEKKKIKFYFENRELYALEGETIASALFANNINTFSYHKKDDSPQGIFCANGQCAQCSVVADNKVVKACITKVKEDMKIQPLKGVAKINLVDRKYEFKKIEEIEVDVLIVGAGPSGMSCAAELGKFNLDVLIIDDKDKAGGKLVLQTHKFFGSVEDCYAGTRGIDIADKLVSEIKQYPSVRLWLDSTCIAVFSDKKIGVVKDNIYYLIKPKVFVVAAGAREKNLIFPGNTLPGVYGAGAFQTLVNRDLIKASDRIFIVGGGNVGLIAGYHAIQANIKVVGLCEAAKSCGGYKVHEDKLKRLGVPIFTRHTILRAGGDGKVEYVVIAEVDDNFKPLANTEKRFDVDTLLIAVGLNPVNEFYHQAVENHIDSFICGDAQEIAEASAAMFSGKITAHKVLKNLGFITGDVPKFWFDKLEILKSRPGKTFEKEYKKPNNSIYPVIHCRQEIPCNPCVSVCPKKSIKLSGESIKSIPYFDGDCIGCFKCLLICPGLAITIVDKRKDANNPIVYLPYENSLEKIKKGEKAIIVDEDSNSLGMAEVVFIRQLKAEATTIIGVLVSSDIAEKVSSVKILDIEDAISYNGDIKNLEDSAIVCRCERVTLGEIRKCIKNGIRDLNQIKAITRAGMGACGAKTCNSLLISIMKSEGVKIEEITDLTKRPLFVETELGVFAGLNKKEGKDISFSGF
jgi:NADPH-dependent 2,4-dienoyl-CoA reductase/sulfur reductase-like enzyme/Fe-S-cluster-containing hydrogenase component 2/bacterioferritin-associated ferredoxin